MPASCAVDEDLEVGSTSGLHRTGEQLQTSGLLHASLEESSGAGLAGSRSSSRMGTLALFCAINLLNSLDRGMFASNGVNGRAACGPHAHSLRRLREGVGLSREVLLPTSLPSQDVPLPSMDQGSSELSIEAPAPDCSPSGIQGDFNLSNFQDGLLPAALLLGILLSSPLFAHASKSLPPSTIIAAGLVVWCGAVAGCSLSWGFVPLLLGRMLVGVGEASFISLAGPCIKDLAPPQRVSSFLAVFYLCGPVGTALGLIFGGLVGPTAGWRGAFAIEAAAMLPLLALAFGRKGDVDTSEVDSSLQRPPGAGAEHGQGSSVFQDWAVLLSNPVFVCNMLGFSAFIFVQGAFAFWVAKAVRAIFGFQQADAVLGAVTVLTGVAGTLSGGLVLDALGPSVTNAFKFTSALTALGATFCILAYLSPNISSFVPLMMIGELFMFSVQSPVNLVTMQSVPRKLRSQAIALTLISIHVLGDIPSPPLLGMLQDSVQDFRLSMVVFTSIFYLAAAIWRSGALVLQSHHQVGGQSTQ